MKTFRVVIGGDRLMQHNEGLANPFGSYTQELQRVSRKKNKTLDDHKELATIEFQGGLYLDDKKGPFVPGHALHKMLVEGARRRKLGKVIEQNVLIADLVNPIKYDGPRDRKGLQARMMEFCDQRLVGIGDKRTLRTRPCFRDWKVEFDIQVPDTSLVNTEDIKMALEAAQTIGLGDGRPTYAGRFKVVSFQEV